MRGRWVRASGGAAIVTVMVSPSVLRLALPDPSTMLGGIRARVGNLADEGQTPFEDLGMCLHRYGVRTSLSALTSRGIGLCFVLQGSKRTEVASRVLQALPGHMIVVTRGADLKAVVHADAADRPYLALSVWFDPERVARALLRLAELEATTEVAEHAEGLPAFITTPTVGIVSAVERLLGAVEDPIDRTTIAPLILDELMFRLLRTDAAGAVRAAMGPPDDVARILDVMQFIRDNHTRKLTVSVLAKRAGMSASHFAHRFPRIAQLSPMKYVREVRLERARTLLGEKGARPTDVATEVGFETAAHFTREFKRRYGVPPSRYRKRVVIP
ncbi:MAG TPA: AraC family transcriptional regulator [Polyangiaceae bacterium]